MPSYTFLSSPSPEQILRIVRLYQDAGWWAEGVDAPELVGRIVTGSHCFLLATVESQIVGMGRAISDGASDAYIQDVTVRHDFRGRGIGTRIVSLLVERLRSDGMAWIGLIAEDGSSPFYDRLGFRPMAGSVPMKLGS